jgi:hypothetical protein
MRQYVFAKVMYKVNSSNLSDAIDFLIKAYPTEDISEMIKSEKIMLVETTVIPNEKKYKVSRPFEFCKKCNTMHRKDSANWKKCLKPKEGSISI